MDGAEAAGFAICHVQTEGQDQPSGEGWIIQMGVRPSRRNRGLGSALLSEVMRRLRAEGLRYAVLDVNVNNAQALHLYQRLGFERTRRYTSYQKRVTPSR